MRRLLCVTTVVAVCGILGTVMTIGTAWACALYSPLGNEVSVREGRMVGGLPLDFDPERLGEQATETTTTSAAGPGIRYQRVEAWHSAYGSCIISLEREDVSCIAGWPWPVLSGSFMQGDFGRAPEMAGWLRSTALPAGLSLRGQRQGRMLPMTPLWPNFALAAALYGLGAFALFAAVELARRAQRGGQHHCAACDYDLRGLPEGAPCPECASPRPREG